MKKYKESTISLLGIDGDYFSSDVVNRDVVEDQKEFLVSDLSNEQARQCLCIALKTLDKERKRLKIITDLIDRL